MDTEDREFMRELLLSHERATDAMIARLDAGTQEMRARTDEIVRRTDAIVRKIDEGTREFVAESRAQRETVFRVLDRLDGGAAGAGA
jgi:hypothetical protein